MEKNGYKSLMMIIFDGKYYIGEISQNKLFALENVVEFTQDKDSEGQRIHLGCFFGSIQAGKLSDRLILALHPKSILYDGYFQVLNNTFKISKEEISAQESELPI
jgi:hypothetical protein